MIVLAPSKMGKKGGGSEKSVVCALFSAAPALQPEVGQTGGIALPGGLGTLEEFFEVWTWGPLGLYAKPCGLAKCR